MRELWRFRDLLLILAERDVKLRYKQTALGLIWVILQPTAGAVIFAAVFGRLIGVPSEGVPYLLFVYAGMLPWTLFAGVVQRAGGSLIADSRLISKVYFPRLIVPLASAGAVLVDFLVALAFMAVLLLVYACPVTWNVLALPALVALLLLIAVGVALWVSSLSIYYRDFAYALPFVLQVWTYASPVVYSAQMVPERWSLLYSLNPIVGVIEGFRWALLGRAEFPALPLGVALIVGTLVFVGGAMVFRRTERRFADVI